MGLLGKNKERGIQVVNKSYAILSLSVSISFSFNTEGKEAKILIRHMHII